MIIQEMWVLICGTLVFFMQAGFTCYEAGLVQSKNVISVSIENLVTFAITVVMFMFIGCPLMFGKSIFSMSGSEYSYLFLQTMFAAVAVTIFAGAMSERSKLTALMIAGAVAAGIIYPVFGKWVWGSMLGGGGAYLGDMGFMDFAGAAVVHSTGGFITLAGLITVGRRKETRSGKSNIPLATLGVFILWFGWLGFNGGNMPITGGLMGLVFINTTLSAGFGMLGALVMNLVLRRKGRYLISIFNGVLGGLVAVTALSGYCGPEGAMAAGFAAGAAADCSTLLLDKFGIDDVVNAVPSHLVGGITGTLLLPFVVRSQYLVCGGRLEQFGVQLIGVCINAAWTLGLSMLIFFLIDKTIGIRVGSEEEKKGLNIVEFNDIYSWESYMEISSYESQINDKNRLLKKQTKILAATEAEEKEKLARELHDGLGQSLAALKLVLKMGAGKKSGGGDAAGKDDISEKALELAETSISEMRNVLEDLRPERLEQGLGKALDYMTQSLDEIEGFSCSFTGGDEMPGFDDPVSLNIYRTVQEALTNVVKHSGASQAEVVCSREADGSCIIRVTDNGRGFDPDAADRGVGLDSMADRIKMIGGDLKIVSGTGKGTMVEIQIKIEDEEQDHGE